MTSDPCPPGAACLLIDSGMPGQLALLPERPPPPWSDWPLQQVDALAQPQLLRELGIGIVPCLVVLDGQRVMSQQPVVAGTRPADAWRQLGARHGDASQRQHGWARTDGHGQDPLLESLHRCLTHNVQVSCRATARLMAATLESAEPGADTQRLLQGASAAAARTADGVDGLVRWLNVQRARPGLSDIDLRSLCQDVLAELRALRAGPLTVTLPTAGRRVRADLSLLSLALAQLLDNACKFSAPVKAPTLHIDCHHGQAMDVISVTDNGAGFSVEHAAALFRPFERIHFASEFPGQGMGLALVRAVASKHGGWCWADMASAGQTRFMLALPNHGELNDAA